MQPDLEWDLFPCPNIFLLSHLKIIEQTLLFSCFLSLWSLSFFFFFLRQKPKIHLLETEHLIYPVRDMRAPSIWRGGVAIHLERRLIRNSQGARSVSTGGMQNGRGAVVKDQSAHLCVESPGAFIWMLWLVDTQHAWCLDFHAIHTLVGELCCFFFSSQLWVWIF